MQSPSKDTSYNTHRPPTSQTPLLFLVPTFLNKNTPFSSSLSLLFPLPTFLKRLLKDINLKFIPLLPIQPLNGHIMTLQELNTQSNVVRYQTKGSYLVEFLSEITRIFLSIVVRSLEVFQV